MFVSATLHMQGQRQQSGFDHANVSITEPVYQLPSKRRSRVKKRGPLVNLIGVSKNCEYLKTPLEGHMQYLEI